MKIIKAIKTLWATLKDPHLLSSRPHHGDEIATAKELIQWRESAKAGGLDRYEEAVEDFFWNLSSEEKDKFDIYMESIGCFISNGVTNPLAETPHKG